MDATDDHTYDTADRITDAGYEYDAFGRTTELPGVILMGVRLYSPGIGRFLQTDPEDGGNATAYDYCAGDPVNCTDLDGKFGWGSIKRGLSKVAKVASYTSFIPGPIGTFAGVVSAVSYAATGNWREAAWAFAGAAAAVVGAGAAVKGVRAIRAIRAASKARKLARLAKAGKGAHISFRGMRTPRVFRWSRFGKRLQDSRWFGSESRHFGNKFSNRAGAREGRWNRQGGRFAIGWSAHGTKKMYGVKAARHVVRARIGQWHRSLFFGRWF